jgi:hypothetical protein
MSADQVHQPDRQVTDPMPDELEEIRADLNYWHLHLYDGDPGSNWWERVKARIEGLRHLENRFLGTRPSIAITNNAVGQNSRINQSSIDQSTNQVSEGIRSVDWELLAQQLSLSCRFLRADSQWSSSTRAEVWTIAGGESKMCKALLQKAGAMLLKSPQLRTQLSREVESETDTMIRWFRFLKQQGCFQVRFFATEDLPDGTTITHTMGSIDNLAENSARVCTECAARGI